MVYYKPDSTNGYQFAFAMPFTNGILGKQHVGFNTFQPSLAPADQSNFVANWIQITNLGSTVSRGQLVFYDMTGRQLGSERIKLEAGARADFAAHRYGPNIVGVVDWIPDSSTTRFMMRNVRYYYSTSQPSETFTGALQIEGRAATGEELVVPLDTSEGSAIIEISNVLAQTIKPILRIYDDTGKLLKTQTLSIRSHGSVHIITDSILKTKGGMATLSSTVAESLIALVMHYQRGSQGDMLSVFGIEGREALGSTFRGSYNTYLGQSCRLWLTNRGSTKVTASITVKRYNGQTPSAAQNVDVPALGFSSYNLCARDTVNSYGVVTVSSSTNNALAANVIRIGTGNSYRFPTPVR